MVQEVRAWHRQWDQYFEVSALGQAGFNIQKSIFLKCFSEDMVSRLDSEHEECDSIKELKAADPGGVRQAQSKDGAQTQMAASGAAA